MNRYRSWKQWVYRRPWRQLLLFGVMLLALFVATMTPAVGENAERFVRQEQAVMALTLESEPDVTLETSLLLQGQRQYQAGQLANALASWQGAVAQFQSQPLRQAVSLTYVSIAAQDLGDWSLAESAMARSLALVADNSSADDIARVKSQVLNVQGRLYLKMGQPEMAWEQWEQAEIIYNQSGDWLGSIGAQINQAQALQTMGFYRRAHLKLTEISQELESQPDSEVKAIALKSLGTVFQTSGSLEDSRKYLDQSLEIYQQLGSETDIVDTLFTLGNTLRLMQESDDAQNYYKQVEAILPGSLLSTRAKVNRFSLLLDTQAWESAQALLPTLVSELKNLPASREAIYSRVNLTESLLSRGDDTHQPMAWLGLDEVVALLTESAHQADVLKDDRAQSLALGELSKIYAYTHQWQGSQDLAKRALALSQNSNAQDISYRWQRQLGQAFQQQGKVDDAIQSYTEAVKTLGHVRRDLLATNADVQFSFRETVEPVYREFVNLLLLPDDAGEPALRQAREVIEELQLAELENYFRSACIDSASESIDRLDSEAAVLYPIILPDRVEVIISMPGVPLRHYRTWQTEDETNQTIGQLFQYFNPALSQRKRLRLSKQVYDWLILPAEAMLADQDIQTLVFVLDGQFRRIPMAALYDGEQYLIEKYGVALTPGMKLLGPHFQNPKPLQALMMGLTEARNGFSALPGVREEIEQVAASVNAEVLFDKAFTKDSLAAEIDRVPFPVLHLATHGQFSSNLEETFLLAWDQKITLGDLDDVLRTRRQQAEPIELMVLSACQTAEGDDRASLGLAGMAIRSGARSTLATLWSVNDDSTAKLITQFYEELSNTELSKAKALRFAQIAILKDPEYSHPFYWAPFVLIGNWLS
ncbi:MAG: CHAT domain-containing protein [Cyanobacteria bacterium P01_F01_bin.53]